MTAKTLTRKKYRIDQTCPVCGEPFSSQGLRLHLFAGHGIKVPAGTTLKEFLADDISREAAAGGAPGDDTLSDVFTATSLKPGTGGYPVSGPGGVQELRRVPLSFKGEALSTSQLRNEVERLKLEGERSRLLAGRQQESKPLDLAQQAGLGEMVDPVKTVVQARAFNVPQDSEDKTLKIIQAFKEMKDLFLPSGGNHSDNIGDFVKMIEAVLKLKELFPSKGQATTAPDFNIAGVPLGSMPVEAIVPVLSYLEQREKNKAEEMKDKEFRGMAADFLTTLGQHKEEVLSGIKGSFAGNAGNQNPTIVEAEVDTEGQIQCPSPGCHNIINVKPQDSQARCEICSRQFQIERKQKENKVEAEAQPTEHPFKCPTCGGETYLNSLGLPDEAAFSCPKCGQPTSSTVGELKQLLQGG